MSKRTPGPWSVEGTFVVRDDGIALCHTWSSRSIPEDVADANARLIAAAPDLLENLEQITKSAKDLINEIVSSPDGKGNWGGLAAHIHFAREAIAKAKGA